MISHVVLFRPKSDLSHDERERLARAFEYAVQRIPTVRAVRIGKRTAVGAAYEQQQPSNSPDVLIAIDFDDVAGLRTYLEHPAHVELGERFTRASSTTLVFDFDVMQSTSGILGFLQPE
jgi:hypothetical protein